MHRAGHPDDGHVVRRAGVTTWRSADVEDGVDGRASSVYACGHQAPLEHRTRIGAGTVIPLWTARWPARTARSQPAFTGMLCIGFQAEVEVPLAVVVAVQRLDVDAGHVRGTVAYGRADRAG